MAFRDKYFFNLLECKGFCIDNFGKLFQYCINVLMKLRIWKMLLKMPLFFVNVIMIKLLRFIR